MAGEERWAEPRQEDWAIFVTPRAPLRPRGNRPAPQHGGDSDALPSATPSPPRPGRREVRFSDAPPEVYGDYEPPVGRDRFPGGKRSPQEEFRRESEQEEVPESTYYLRSQRRQTRPSEPYEMQTRRVTRLQQQQQQSQPQPRPPSPATARRGLRDSRFSEEDEPSEPSSQRALSPTDSKKSMRTSKEIPVLSDDPISELRRPPLRNSRPDSAFKTNGNSNLSELDDSDDKDQESSNSDASSSQHRRGEALESAGSEYVKASQEWDEQIGGGRPRKSISSGGRSSVSGNFSEDDKLMKSVSGNQHPPNASQKVAGLPRESSSLGLWCSIAVVMVAGVALCLWPWWTSKAGSPAVQEFQSQMQQLMRRYHGQDEKLWKRSARLLEKHLNSSQPRPQPAILLLTAARDAEDVLRCLGEQIADAYAASLSRSVQAIRIDSVGMAARDSSAVKHQVDQELTRGFESGQTAAVVHRFESLPASATLIFYKYCDHEHAAFKDVALVLTVLLEDKTLGASPDLKQIEEKVRDFLRVKFIDASASSSHDRMDSDKLSGLWSRISHLVLPVQPERAQKRGSCL